MPIDERWYGLGDFARLINLEGIEFREYQFNVIKASSEERQQPCRPSDRPGEDTHRRGTDREVPLRGQARSTSGAHEAARRAAPPRTDVACSISSLTRLPSLMGTVGKGQDGHRAKRGHHRRDPADHRQRPQVRQLLARRLRHSRLRRVPRAVGKYAYTYIANELAVRGADRRSHRLSGQPQGQGKRRWWAR